MEIRGFGVGKMEGEMEVPQVGILLIALLYQKSLFLRAGFLSCLQKCCEFHIFENKEENNESI